MCRVGYALKLRKIGMSSDSWRKPTGLGLSTAVKSLVVFVLPVAYSAAPFITSTKQHSAWTISYALIPYATEDRQGRSSTELERRGLGERFCAMQQVFFLRARLAAFVMMTLDDGEACDGDRDKSQSLARHE